MNASIKVINEERGIPEGAPLSGRLAEIPVVAWVTLACGLASVGFHLYLLQSGLLQALVSRPLHLIMALPWIFVLVPAKNSFERWTAPVFFVAGLWVSLWLMWNHNALIRQYGTTQSLYQDIMCVAIILVVLEMARRAVKWVLPLIALIILTYGLFGQHIPGYFGHAGLPTSYFFGTLVLTEGGLWSNLTGISAETIAPFVMLGAVISAGAAGTGFMALATQIAGRYRAGVAKVAVISSALYGTISGVAAANTASTGMVTIPAMIRLGYPRSLAAAVEAVASTGGQIMPPLMGAGIFVMAELLALPYTTIMLAATLPAISFFIAVWIAIHLYGLKLNLGGLNRADLPGWPLVLRTLPFFVVPFGILIYALAFTSYTAEYAAFFAILATSILLLVDSLGKVKFRRWLYRLWLACVDAAAQIAQIAAIIICASLIVGVFNMTGVGVKITSIILSASGGSLWVALLLTALAALILGMELPTTAAYVIVAAVAAPALTELGLPVLYAHLFVFWYALLCTITPPVCGNVFIASAIADAPWLNVAGRSMVLGVGLYVVPLGFVANPSMLMLVETPTMALLATLKVLLGLFFLGIAVVGHIPSIALRVLSLIAAFAIIFLSGV